jgi:uncharacterized protein YajQ (UPF0234 family)
MAKEHYFDITAKLDIMELKNAIAMAKKEVQTRFDFKGIVAEFNFNEKDKTLNLSSSSSSKADALKDILISKLISRNLSSKSIEEIKTEGISGGNVKIIYKLVDSIDKEEAKLLTKEIKDMKLKVTTRIQGDEIRVSAKKLDDLQAVMSEIKKLDLKAPIVFGNFN